MSVDIKIAFALRLKAVRAKKRMTQQEVADKLGMKNIYSYQRLEKKANPSLKMMEKIIQIFPEFNIDNLFIDN